MLIYWVDIGVWVVEDKPFRIRCRVFSPKLLFGDELIKEFRYFGVFPGIGKDKVSGSGGFKFKGFFSSLICYR